MVDDRSLGENFSEWWNETVIPQIGRGGDPVSTRVIEDVADKPHSFADEDRDGYGGESECGGGDHTAELRADDDSDNDSDVSYPEMYCQRPALILDETTIVDESCYEHFEDHELPVYNFWVPNRKAPDDYDGEVKWWWF